MLTTEKDGGQLKQLSSNDQGSVSEGVEDTWPQQGRAPREKKQQGGRQLLWVQYVCLSYSVSVCIFLYLSVLLSLCVCICLSYYRSIR